MKTPRLTSNRTSCSVQSADGSQPLYERDAHWCDYVQAIAVGDAAALTSLYDESAPIVYATIQRLLRNVEDSEEVADDVYAQVWRTAGSFDIGRCSVIGWLTMLARSRAIDRIRTRAHSEREEFLNAGWADCGITNENPEVITSNLQNCQRVEAALQSLSPDQRIAIELAFYGGFTQSELALKLGQPLGTVKTRIRLGIGKLRQQLRRLELQSEP